MRILYALLFLSVSTCVSAQITYSVSGQVFNEKGEALFGASIVCRNNASGTAADSGGNFSLKLAEVPAYLEISFIGYKTHFLSLNKSVFDSLGHANFNIELKPLTEQLTEATVTGKAYANYFTHPGFEVFDFAFVNNNILLLLRHKHAYKLVLLNEAQDSLAFLPLKKPAGGLVSDCLGQRYLLTKDSVLALSFADNQIQLLGGIDLEFYTQRIKPCVVANTHTMYYHFYQFNNQLMEIFQSPKAGEESKKIMQLVDWDEALSIDEYGQIAKAMAENNGSMGEMKLLGLELFKEGFERMAWFKHMLAKPGYNPMFAYRDGALLFNHLNDSVQHIDASGAVAKSFPIAYHKQKDFNKQIIEDYVTQEHYVVFASGGMWRLGLLSAENYSVQEEILIREHDFPQALKIRRGVAYYLDYDEDDYSRLKLYRQNLK